MALRKQQFTATVGGKTLTVEISSLAEQTNAAVLVRYGGTVVLVTAVMGREEKNLDYMPLKVDYEERFYAAGKIIGSRFIRREGRPSEDAILAGRIVDRTIRPLFDHRLRREIQVVATVLAFDEENDPDFVGLVGASLVLGISDIPWNGPVAGVRIAKIGDSFVINPGRTELLTENPAFETFVAGVKDKINMIELGGYEAKETDVLAAFKRAQEEINALIVFEESIIGKVGKKKTEVVLTEADATLRAAAEAFLASRLEDAVYQKNKMEQSARMAELHGVYMEHLRTEFSELNEAHAEALLEEAIDALVHKNILEADRRPDGRAPAELRALDGETGLFERTHGSALFVRGNTQALAVITLAPPGAEQVIESMETMGKRRFLLHYNFPPYSVGETGTFRGPGRREIGHGALADKAVRPLIPSQEEFPYTVRVVSEILSSNGSSSMATVCASVMALMDAGVPIKKPAAGIAMGLMSDDKGNYKILTDIQGPEDHYGDMDFKVAGTDEGVNAVQMDVKVNGVTLEIIEKTLVQGRDARMQILSFVKTVIPAPRATMSKYVPIIIRLKINPEKIGMVIGPGGKTINGMIKNMALASIDIDEDGSVFVSADTEEKAEQAAKHIAMLTKEFKIGDIVEGAVVKMLDFGAIVDLGGGQDGMIHVSELKEGFVKNVGDVVKLGDFVRAKVIRVDADGHIGLSLKQMK